MKKKSLIAIIILIVLVAVAVAVAIKIASSNSSSDKSAIFAVPKSENGAQINWQNFAPQISSATGFKNVSPKFYSSEAELISLLDNAKKNNLLFAWLPINNEFYSDDLLAHFAKLNSDKAKNALLPSIKRFSQLESFEGINATPRTSQNNDKPLQFFPVCFDSYIVFGYQNKSKNIPEAKIAIPAKSVEETFAAYAFGIYLTGKENAISTLDTLLAKKQFQNSPFTYNTYETFLYFQNRRSEFAFLPMSYVNTLPFDDAENIMVADFPDFSDFSISSNANNTLIANFYVVGIPKCCEEMPELLEKIIALVSSKEFVSAQTSLRGAIPATHSSSVQNINTKNAQNSVTGITEVIIPKLLQEKDDKNLLYNKIQFALATKN